MADDAPKTAFTHDDRVRFRRMAADVMFDMQDHRSDVEHWIETGGCIIYAYVPGLSREQWAQLDRVARALALAAHRL